MENLGKTNEELKPSNWSLRGAGEVFNNASDNVSSFYNDVRYKTFQGISDFERGR